MRKMNSLRIVTCAYVLYIFGVINAQQCNDCVSLRSCPGALKFINDEIIKKTDNNKSQQRYDSAVCGFDDDIPKVCCSEFPEVDDQIEKHPNMALLPQTCGDIDGDRIVGGTTAKLFEFPWMALISYNLGRRYGFQCAGSIINDRYILTAAHCVNYTEYTIAGVRIGEFDISTENDCQGEPGCESPIQDIYIEKPIVHKSYDRHTLGKYDIALLRLDRPIQFRQNRNAAPICLPKTSKLRNVVIDGMNGTVAGWGLTENRTSSSVLMKVNVPIMASESCPKRYGRAMSDKTFCAGELNKDSCNGDSGGPLMIKENYNGVSRYVQHGIVSYGSKYCGSNFPGVYTDVSKFVKWILDNIEP